MIKTILYTMFLTLSAIVFSLYLAAKSGMAILGYTLLTPAKSAAYASSAAAVQKLSAVKKRAVARKSKVTQRFTKRAGKRLAASAAAAATVGTAAVIATVSVIEADDYCDELAEIQTEIDLLNDQQTQFDKRQCLDQAKEEMSSSVAALWDKFKLNVGESIDWFRNKWRNFLDQGEAEDTPERISA